MNSRLTVAAALVVGLTGIAGCGAPREGKLASKQALPFIEDDYPRALSEARSRKLPIFAEAWAPW